MLPSTGTCRWILYGDVNPIPDELCAHRQVTQVHTFLEEVVWFNFPSDECEDIAAFFECDECRELFIVHEAPF